MDIWDHEGNATAIYAEAGADPHDPPGPHGLARRLGIAVRYDGPRTLAAAHAIVRGQETIFVRPGLTPLVEGVRIFHELAERHLRGTRAEPAEDVERACDELAYHLRMPRAAFRALVGVVGRDLEQLAAPWPATQTAAALRYLEVTDTPGVVVTPRDVRVRGPEWGWPPADDLRRLARARSLPDGVERHAIADRRAAALLVAA